MLVSNLKQETIHVVSRAGRQVHLPPCTRNNVHKYRICCHNNIITKKFIFLTRDFSDMLLKHVGAGKVF